ncbi:hypothetical protein PRECH8_13550 [Insulibacter thermoxylanivorax]|uniref:Uncharacterized protein n=1 Tax=Insulibacter thermoxylanivorax TaxID=2749268 RepID=A0A916VFV5_9BACL|nr:hypothetical protein [Insulibacter thermoxylanivorax]GFR38059.1 hypothetical protein PRECH8_13550 [Insulibacter thermoxylanivorax]
MYNWMFFIHLASLATWFGVTLMGMIMLLSVKSKLAENHASLSSVTLSVLRNINRITHPAAFLVLASGLYMIMQWNRDGMPFWLAFMEQAGGLVIILFMILLSIFGARMKKSLAGSNGAAAAKSISIYAWVAAIFLLAILVVTLVVSLKL